MQYGATLCWTLSKATPGPPTLNLDWNSSMLDINRDLFPLAGYGC